MMHPVLRSYTRRHPHRLLRWFGFWLILFSGRVAAAQTLPAGFNVVTVVTGLDAPTVVTPLPDGRLLVAQQTGTLRVVKNGALLATPFVQLTVDASGERGLIGVAVDPDFTTNSYLYLYYTVPGLNGGAAHNRVSRFTANGDRALDGSETVILEVDPLSGANNHNGGAMAFGADKKLYIGVGENANPANSQNLDNYLGKLLRINADGSVPAGNPFLTGTEAKKRIWSYGLRNPYTLTVQPRTGRIFVNDVGQNTWEEVNDATAGGLNFGWPAAEGNSNNPAFANPVYQYPHGGGDGLGCAITGGTFYNPKLTMYPAAYIGQYFLQDFCSTWINTLNLTGPTAVRSSFGTEIGGFNLSITTGSDGYLYLLSKSNGSLLRINYTGDVASQTLQPGDWQTAALWSSGQVPVAGVQAVVGHPVTVGAVSEATHLRFNAGGQLVFSAGGRLRLGF